jgi:hypothetical protein
MRLQWGLWSILGRLGAEGSFQSILEDSLAAPVTGAAGKGDAGVSSEASALGEVA